MLQILKTEVAPKKTATGCASVALSVVVSAGSGPGQGRKLAVQARRAFPHFIYFPWSGETHDASSKTGKDCGL